MKILTQQLFDYNQKKRQSFPNKIKAEAFIDHLFKILFINQQTQCYSYKDFELEFKKLEAQLYNLLMQSEYNHEAAELRVKQFFDALPKVHDSLIIDAQAILDFDPAAQTLDEVLQCYPGFFAIAIYRFSHDFWQRNVCFLARIFSEFAHSKTGIDIHPGATIGRSFAIDHGTGIVIGETTLIGDNVKIYQGVTLGALSVKKDNTNKKRHPTIEDEVVMYAGATVLGGDTVIGHHSVLGGNVWVTSSIPSYTVVYHKNEIYIKNSSSYNDPVNFII